MATATPAKKSASDSLTQRLERARREARLTEAAWRRKRAEVARLVAAGEEAAAARLVAAVEGTPGGQVTAEASPSPRETETAPPVAMQPPPSPAASAAISNRPRKAAARQVTLPSAAPKPAQQPEPERKRSQPPKPAKQPLPREAIRRRNRLSQGWLASAHEWASRKPGWAHSLAIHGFLLALLGLLTFGAWTEPPLVLEAAFASDADAYDVMPESTPVVELDASVEEPAEVSLELASLATGAIEPQPLELAAVSLTGDLLAGSAAGLLEEVGAGSEATDGDAAKPAAPNRVEGSGESPGGVRFFGAEHVASRVAFVVDNSGSMQRGRMETTLMELDRAVHRLTESQYFYVVLFSDQAYPMFYPQPADGMLPATRQNKRLLSNWLGSVEMCLGGRLLDAVEMAASVEPEVVYLLTDGDIRSTRVVSRLGDGEAWDFAIHTLGMGVRTPQDAAKLQAIAAANDGVFRPVRATPEAIRRSQLRPMPYHNTPGGTTWGSAIQAWKD